MFLALLQAATGKREVTSNGASAMPGPEPAVMFPALDGTAFPPYRQVFQSGECTREDGRGHPLPGGGGTTVIDPDKICFSCFRVPTLLGGQVPGVVHAFAEGRRGELDDLGAALRDDWQLERY